MYKFAGKEVVITIPKSQIKEAVLYKNSLYIKLFNKVEMETISEDPNKLETIFNSMKEKNSFGNFINMREIF